MTDGTFDNRAGPIGLAHRVIVAWALVGGVVLVTVVLINAYSILASAIINKPFPGDFELTELGVGIAAFCFLPYCQLTGANVSADIFTINAGPRAIALMNLLASLIALSFAALLIWRMSAGLQDYIEYQEFTSILNIPLWWAFVPAVLSLALLIVATIVSLIEHKSSSV